MDPPATPEPEPMLQRRLARLRFDLHDGPQQEVHLLGQDLALFRDQLAAAIAEHPDRARLLGRLDDLQAQLVALDSDLRRLITSARSPLIGTSLGESLMEVAAGFTARTGIVPATDCTGDIESLTDSQQIALLSLVREALTNARQHAGAEHVTIRLHGGAEAVTVEIADDGAGFDPARTEPRAASAGHLGLLGMRERMRMLGGETEIRSAPGGPTVVAATLPRWPADPPA